MPTGGGTSDDQAVDASVAMRGADPGHMLADKGYDGNDVRGSPLIRGILRVIPPRANGKGPPACEFQAYRDRTRMERMFSSLEQPSRIATRHDRTALSFPGFLTIAASRIRPEVRVNRA